MCGQYSTLAPKKTSNPFALVLFILLLFYFITLTSGFTIWHSFSILEYLDIFFKSQSSFTTFPRFIEVL